jgi:hypothetical protein
MLATCLLLRCCQGDATVLPRPYRGPSGCLGACFPGPSGGWPALKRSASCIHSFPTASPGVSRCRDGRVAEQTGRFDHARHEPHESRGVPEAGPVFNASLAKGGGSSVPAQSLSCMGCLSWFRPGVEFRLMIPFDFAGRFLIIETHWTGVSPELMRRAS